MRLLHFAILALVPATIVAQPRPRGRALGIPFSGKTGPHNAITDVAGVAVGHTTIIRGEGKVERGKGPVRTGVTAILPRPAGVLPSDRIDPLFRTTIDATEEAVVNAMLAAPAVFDGADGLRAYGLPGDRVLAALKKYGRIP
jgi:L-aminopeptidase/D-esterase-like protein